MSRRGPVCPWRSWSDARSMQSSGPTSGPTRGGGSSLSACSETRTWRSSRAARPLRNRDCSTRKTDGLRGGQTRGADQPQAPAGEEVNAGQPLPLVVRRQQRLVLALVGLAAVNGGEQLEEAEVAGEAVAVAAESLERDDTHRPPAQPTLSREPRGGVRDRHTPEPLEIKLCAYARERRRGDWLRGAHRARSAGRALT